MADAAGTVVDMLKPLTHEAQERSSAAYLQLRERNAARLGASLSGAVDYFTGDTTVL